jgi:hypothetical protein
MDIKGPVTFAILFSPPQKVMIAHVSSGQRLIAPLLIARLRYGEDIGKISLDLLRLYLYDYSNMAKLRNRIVEAGSKANMRKTTIELTEEQYFFLKEKALELQRQN